MSKQIKNNFTKSSINSNKFITVLSLGVLSVLMVGLSMGESFNYQVGASKGVKTTTFGEIVDSKSKGCDVSYKYSLILDDSEKCVPSVIKDSLVENKKNKRIKIDGVIKDGVFYVTDTNNINSGPTMKPSSEPLKRKTAPIPSTKPTQVSE